MADGKVKATLIPSGIFRWQRFPFVPVRHSPWNHLQMACFPWAQRKGWGDGKESLPRQRKMIPNGDGQIYKWGPTALKMRGSGGATGWSRSLQRSCFKSASHSRDSDFFAWGEYFFNYNI